MWGLIHSKQVFHFNCVCFNEVPLYFLNIQAVKQPDHRLQVLIIYGQTVKQPYSQAGLARRPHKTHTLSSSSSLVTMTIVGQSSSQTILQKSSSVVLVGPWVAMYWLLSL